MDADYNRETGLKGDRTSKYLNSNRANNADPQDDNHNAIYLSALETDGGTVEMGAGYPAGRNMINVLGTVVTRCRQTLAIDTGITPGASGLVAFSRSDSSGYDVLAYGNNFIATAPSDGHASENVFVFANNIAGSGAGVSSARIAFYSIGEAISDLALLDSRVSTLVQGVKKALVKPNADAADWIRRVEANGGTVSTSTANAVTDFCNAIDAAGIRDRFYRLNLFCGTGLNAALVPLFRTWRVYSGRNLLAVGDNLSASAWTKSGTTVTQSSSERPFAYGPYANVVTATAGTSVTPYVVASGVTGYGTVTYSAYLKANGHNTVRILPIGTAGQTFPGGGTVAYANINLSTGAISNVLAGTTATATNVGNGWWRLAYTVTNNGTGQTSLRFDIGTGSPYNAAGTESVLFWGLQNELGSTATEFDPYPLGNATDTNVGPFSSGDYVETGASGGLLGNGSSKYLNTGLQTDALPDPAIGHLSAYVTGQTSSRAGWISAFGAGFANGSQVEYNHTDGNTFRSWGREQLLATTPGTVDHLLVTRGGTTDQRAYNDGALVSTNTTLTTMAGSSAALTVLARNVAGSVGAYSDGRVSFYSIGDNVSTAQVSSFYAALLAFQQALERA